VFRRNCWRVNCWWLEYVLGYDDHHDDNDHDNHYFNNGRRRWSGSGGLHRLTGFRASSPLDGFPDGDVTFRWDAPRSAVEQYKVFILNDRGALVRAYDSVGPLLSLTGNTSLTSIGKGNRFSWYVTALVGGSEVCRSSIATLNRVWIDGAGLSS